MLNDVINITKSAGEKILEIYHNDDFEVKIKEDKSPLTKADLASNDIIVQGLKNISDIPIVSEEVEIDYEARKKWSTFWLVDPLDGTKDFIAKNHQFTVNIALIENKKPVLGVLYAPALGLMYWAKQGEGSYKNGEKIFNHSNRENLIASDSMFHSTEETMNFLMLNNISNIQRFGSALKFGKLAEGEIDIYPRFNGTKEWDTAAGQVILTEAGCKIIDLKTQTEMEYNKTSIKNNYFIAMRNDLEINYESNRISCRTRR